MPACFRTPLAVKRLRVPASTVKVRPVIGLNQISCSPLPCRTKRQPYSAKMRFSSRPYAPPSGGDRYCALVKGDQPQQVRPLSPCLVDQVRIVLDQLGHNRRRPIAQPLKRITSGDRAGHVAVDRVPNPRFGIVGDTKGPEAYRDRIPRTGYAAKRMVDPRSTRVRSVLSPMG